MRFWIPAFFSFINQCSKIKLLTTIISKERVIHFWKQHSLILLKSTFLLDIMQKIRKVFPPLEETALKKGILGHFKRKKNNSHVDLDFIMSPSKCRRKRQVPAVWQDHVPLLCHCCPLSSCSWPWAGLIGSHKFMDPYTSHNPYNSNIPRLW